MSAEYLSPDSYWKTEAWYSLLSLTSKLYLGIILYINVLMYSSFDDALNHTPAARATTPASG